jgi:hypothetical protein
MEQLRSRAEPFDAIEQWRGGVAFCYAGICGFGDFGDFADENIIISKALPLIHLGPKVFGSRKLS